MKLLSFLVILPMVFCLSIYAWAQDTDDRITVERKDGWFYVNGEKFFVKGVCFFENHNVEGEFRRSSLEVLDYEFRRIKEAGFNTIRSQLRPEEIELARKHGLMVMQAANHLFFSNEYEDPAFIREQIKTTEEITRYSRNHDNILYYIIDNEPQIDEGIYRQGEKAILSFYTALIRAIKKIEPEAVVSMASYPPAQFLDYSIFDCISLNLYPFCPACNSIGYQSYANWFKRQHAKDKPFIISEYGWRIEEGQEILSSKMTGVLDTQIASGAAGSFFYTWRAFGEEAQGSNLWYGIIPNNGKKDDYKNKARPIYDDFKKYFEAVIIEPKKEGIYKNKIPIRAYGTERTGSMSASFGENIYELKKAGRYWWGLDIPLSHSGPQASVLTVVARDKAGNILVEKKQPVFINNEKKNYTVRIISEDKKHQAGGTYRAKVIVYDKNKKRVSNAKLVFGINQTGLNVWSSAVRSGQTDSRGEYEFIWPNISAGYFSLIAGIKENNQETQVYSDVDTVRVERKY